MKRRSVTVVVLACLLATVGLAALNDRRAPARAADIAAPQAARPQQNGADWLVQNAAFESDYPHGFTVRIQASSSGGELKRVRLIWNRASQRPTETLTIYAIDAEQDAATGALTATWEPGTTQMLPPWALLAYHWEFRDAAGNEYKTDPVEVEYEDHTRPWRRSESEDAIVYASDLPESVENMVLDALAQQHDKYLAVWGEALPYRPRIVLFGDFDAWTEWQTEPNSSGGVRVGLTLDEWGVIVQVVYPLQDQASLNDLAYATVVHETEHLYQREFMWATRDMYDIPSWLMEGDATFFQLYQDYDYLGHVQEMAAGGTLPRLLTVNPSDAPRTDGPNPRDGYDIGYSFFVWLQEKSDGLDAERQLMKLLAEDVPFFDALEQVTGMTVDEIERDWRVWLGASPDAPELIPTWTPSFPVVITPPPTGK